MCPSYRPSRRLVSHRRVSHMRASLIGHLTGVQHPYGIHRRASWTGVHITDFVILALTANLAQTVPIAPRNMGFRSCRRRLAELPGSRQQPSLGAHKLAPTGNQTGPSWLLRRCTASPQGKAATAQGEGPNWSWGNKILCPTIGVVENEIVF